MDIKEIIESAVEKVTKALTDDNSLLKQFKKNPIQIVEKIIGKDLPDEAVGQVVNLVKSKLGIDTSSTESNAVKDVIDGITGFFKK